MVTEIDCLQWLRNAIAVVTLKLFIFCIAETISVTIPEMGKIWLRNSKFHWLQPVTTHFWLVITSKNGGYGLKWLRKVMLSMVTKQVCSGYAENFYFLYWREMVTLENG